MSTIRPQPPDRDAFRAFLPIVTRWGDNDSFGHIAGSVYPSFVDSAITAWLHAGGMVAFGQGPMWMVAELGVRYFTEAAFPEPLSAGLRIGHLGRSSVRFEVGIFRDGPASACAEGHMVQVSIDPATRRPAPLSPAMRDKLTPLLVTGP